MDDGDYQTGCREFIEKFAIKIGSSSPEKYEIPFRLVTFYLVPSEVEGECLEWIRRFLSLHGCPIGLLSQLTRAVYRNFEDSVNLSKFFLEPDDKHDDEDDEIDGNQSQSSSDDDHIRNSNPPQLDASKLLLEVVSYIHTTVKSWTTSLPVLSAQPACLQVCSHAIKNTRRRMEDKHVMIPDLNVLFDLLKQGSPRQSYFAVFDGHGGLEAAEYAATHLHGHLVSDHKFNTDPEAAMKQAYKTTDIKFLEKAKREGLRSGTTGVSVLIRESEVYLGWLGDSQALLVCSGQPVQIMNPHKPEREDERRRIEDLGGCVLFLGVWRVNGSIAVSRAIGDAAYKPFISSDADVTRFSLTGEEEYLVLACDGLWDVLTPSQVTNIVYKHSRSSPGRMNDVAVGLVNAARDSGSSDNISVIVIFFKSSLSPPKAANGNSVLFGINQVSEKNLDKLASSSSGSHFKPPTLKEKVKSKASGKTQEGQKQKSGQLLEGSFSNFHSSSCQTIFNPHNNNSHNTRFILNGGYKNVSFQTHKTPSSQELIGETFFSASMNTGHQDEYLLDEQSLKHAITENTQISSEISDDSKSEIIRGEGCTSTGSFSCSKQASLPQVTRSIKDNRKRQHKKHLRKSSCSFGCDRMSVQYTLCMDISLLYFLLYKYIRQPDRKRDDLADINHSECSSHNLMVQPQNLSQIVELTGT